ncbi:MAG TPA: HNH endonuclease family protein, partial [Solirubrobacteraceae bacterium]
PPTREAFANDPLELLAVDARANRAKGDGDAATWLPANKAFRCSYVARQVAVKTKYRLWITQAEKDAISRVLATCPGHKLPAPGAPVHVTATSTPTTSATTPAQPAPSPAPASAGASNKPVSEVNCSDFATHAAAQRWFTAHGGSAANDVAGLDGNHDGTACQDLP